MTTADIEALANSDGMATADMESRLKRIHRRMVIPEFFRDLDRAIGRLHWRRKTTTFAVVVGTRNYDCPTDFDKFEILIPGSPTSSTNLEATALDYIGEDPLDVLKAEAATDTSKPTAYYLVAGATNQFAIRLSAPPDASYTLYGVYYRMIPWADDNAPVNLDTYIPWQYQGGLVKRLRMEILKDRIGIRDNRYTTEQAEYREWIMSLEFAKEPAPRTKVVTCR